jgi:DNA-binding GntR family transcriptional regulator
LQAIKNLKSSNGNRGRQKLREKAYESFTQHLLSGRIRPGQFLSQRELTELTGLPLGAIRELIPRLEVEGFIMTVPQRGMQVVHADVKLIRDAFQFRLFLEREAAAVFAQQASDAMLAQLRKEHESILANFERASRKGGLSANLVAEAQNVDWKLHNTLIDFLGNAIITSAYRVNLLKLRIFRREQTRLDETHVIPTMREHLAVLDALETRDSRKAADAISAHIIRALDRALGLQGPVMSDLTSANYSHASRSS